jgi:mycothiol S-conjugate amidase
VNLPIPLRDAPIDGAGRRLRLMHVHAHPDDESSKGAASTVRYVREGVEVLVVTCTGGERGDILNPAMDSPEVLERLPEIRAAEMDRAREILGVQQRWLGFPDSGLPEGDPKPPLPEGCFALVPLEESVGRLTAIIRDFRPQVVTTYDESGGYPHPDHIRCHEVTVGAFEAAGDPERYPEAGPAYHPVKLYYHHSHSRERIMAMHDAMLERGMESPYAQWLDRWEDKPGWESRVTTRVPCGDYFEERDAALIAHATQIDPEGFWFKVPRDLQREVWPTEDYELVRSLVDVDKPEDDLFAGVRSTRPSNESVATDDDLDAAAAAAERAS